MTTQLDHLNYLKDLWFTVNYWTRQISTVDEVIQICQNPATLVEFNKQDIEFDGIVIKVMELDACTLLWSTDHHPRRGMAYKFPAQQVATKLLDVEFQVGRTGIITPVWQVEPTQLSGASISKVSLHNFDIIKTKDIRLWDRVWIQRSGEVIPYVVGPIVQTRTGRETEILWPDSCPICWHHTFVEDEDNGGYLLYCPNPTCPAQIKERITHFVSRDCMDIDGLGEQIIELLVGQEIIHTFADLYKLTELQYRPTLNALPGFKSKKIDNLVASLEASKTTKLWRILNAIGIRQVGTKTAKLVIESIEEEVAKGLEKSEKYSKKSASSANRSEKNDSSPLSSWERVAEPGEGLLESSKLWTLVYYLTDSSFLSQIHGIGDKTVQSCINWFSDPDNISLLQQLADAWVQFDNYETNKRSGNWPLSWVRFAITGSFPLARSDINQQLVRLWAEYCENITKNVTHLIVWQDPSSKVAKAEKNWSMLIQWVEWVEKEWNIAIEKPLTSSLRA